MKKWAIQCSGLVNLNTDLQLLVILYHTTIALCHSLVFIVIIFITIATILPSYVCCLLLLLILSIFSFKLALYNDLSVCHLGHMGQYLALTFKFRYALHFWTCLSMTSFYISTPQNLQTVLPL